MLYGHGEYRYPGRSREARAVTRANAGKKAFLTNTLIFIMLPSGAWAKLFHEEEIVLTTGTEFSGKRTRKIIVYYSK